MTVPLAHPTTDLSDRQLHNSSHLQSNCSLRIPFREPAGTGALTWGQMESEPRFLVDAMLGTLAKWLRILGFDAVYDPSFDDHQLVRIARAQDRVLLSRDTGLVRHRAVRSLWVESQVLEEQLAQVIQEYRLQADNPFSRCPACNHPLEAVPKGEAWGHVPPFVFQTQERFSICPKCNRFYWRGTHWQRMLDHIDRSRLGSTSQ